MSTGYPKIENQLVREFKKFSPEAKGAVLQYTKWMRDIEAHGRLRELKNSKPKELRESLQSDTSQSWLLDR